MVIKKNAILIIGTILGMLFLICFLFISGSYSKVNNNKIITPTLIIDAGHGGEDGGAVAYDGTVEKDINLSISLMLKELLELQGYKVIMTRSNDNAIYDEGSKTLRQKKVSDIHNRFKIIEENPDALFVSIHQNKFESGKYSGAQIFYSPNNPSSVDFAECIQQSFVSHLQPTNTRQIKKADTDIYLLYHAKSTAIMAECGFMSNKDELENLKTKEYQFDVAFTIFCGINNYISQYLV